MECIYRKRIVAVCSCCKHDYIKTNSSNKCNFCEAKFENAINNIGKSNKITNRNLFSYVSNKHIMAR